MTGEHLDDVLSAYLDGELTDAERVDVDAHLSTCAECRSDLEAEAEVRLLVRQLPAVDAPFGFYERILRHGPGVNQAPAKKRRLRFGLANIAGAAAAWLLILGVVNVNSAEGSVEPVPATYVSAHESADIAGSESSDEAARAQATYDAPSRLAGTYQLVAYSEEDGIPQLIYTDGRRTVSMFLRPGRLNQDALPSDATPVHVNGALAWQVPTTQGAVVFLQRPGVVVILVGADPDQVASDVAESAGPRADDHESFLDHVTDAGTGLLETFGFQG